MIIIFDSLPQLAERLTRATYVVFLNKEISITCVWIKEHSWMAGVFGNTWAYKSRDGVLSSLQASYVDCKTVVLVVCAHLFTFECHADSIVWVSGINKLCWCLMHALLCQSVASIISFENISKGFFDVATAGAAFPVGVWAQIKVQALWTIAVLELYLEILFLPLQC